jgi:hypothetical protein
MIESTISPDKKGRYQVLEPESAVFLVGPELRKTSDVISGMPLDFVVSGTWPFKEKTSVRRRYSNREAIPGFDSPPIAG